MSDMFDNSVRSEVPLKYTNEVENLESCMFGYRPRCEWINYCNLSSAEMLWVWRQWCFVTTHKNVSVYIQYNVRK